MELHDADLEAYVRLVAPDVSVERRAERLAQLRDSVGKGERRLADTRVAKSPAGDLRAVLRLASAGGETFTLAGPLVADANADAAAAELVAEAMQRAREQGARIIRSRPKKEAGPLYCAALLEHGFDALGERIEFKTPVASLPLDDGTPLLWRDLAEVGEERAAAMLLAVAAGDPRGDEDEDPRAALAEWLGAPRLTNGPGCVQVGFLDDRAVAFVCAQVSPEDGWSRISYMGLVPDVRGRGLGTWVHRRGFRILREQGGKLYHGGTTAANAVMLRLFRKHGCEEVARMLEFEWHAPASTGQDGARSGGARGTE